MITFTSQGYPKSASVLIKWSFDGTTQYKKWAQLLTIVTDDANDEVIGVHLTPLNKCQILIQCARAGNLTIRSVLMLHHDRYDCATIVNRLWYAETYQDIDFDKIHRVYDCDLTNIAHLEKIDVPTTSFAPPIPEGLLPYLNYGSSKKLEDQCKFRGRLLFTIFIKSWLILGAIVGANVVRWFFGTFLWASGQDLTTISTTNKIFVNPVTNPDWEDLELEWRPTLYKTFPRALLVLSLVTIMLHYVISGNALGFAILDVMFYLVPIIFVVLLCVLGAVEIYGIFKSDDVQLKDDQSYQDATPSVWATIHYLVKVKVCKPFQQ